MLSIKNTIIPIVIILFFALLAYWLISNKPLLQQTTTPAKVESIVTQHAHLSNHPIHINLYGVIKNFQVADLNSYEIGRVKKINISIGEKIKKGQLLITIDDHDLRIKLKQVDSALNKKYAEIHLLKNNHYYNNKSIADLKLQYNLVSTHLKRHQDLYIKEHIAQAKLDEIKSEQLEKKLDMDEKNLTISNYPHELAQLIAELNTLKADKTQLVRNIERCNIKAPFDGHVIKLLVAVGQRVEDGTELLTVMSKKAFVVVALIPERNLPLVHQALDKNLAITGKAKFLGRPMIFNLVRLLPVTEQGRFGTDGILIPARYSDKLTLNKTIALTLAIPTDQKTYALSSSAFYPHETIYKVVNNRLRAIKVQRLGRTKINNETLVIFTSSAIKKSDNIMVSVISNPMNGLEVKRK